MTGKPSNDVSVSEGITPPRHHGIVTPSDLVASGPMVSVGPGQSRQRSRDNGLAREWAGLGSWNEMVAQTLEKVPPAAAQEPEVGTEEVGISTDARGPRHWVHERIGSSI